MLRLNSLVCFCLLTLSACTPIPKDKVKETVQRGNEVVSAIYEFNQKNSLFPKNIEELEVYFSREIPRPTVGESEWKYFVFKDGTFALEFYGRNYAYGYEYFSGEENPSWKRIDMSF